MSGNFWSFVKNKQPKTPEPAHTDRYVGLEIELENVLSIAPPQENVEIYLNPRWNYKRDGSLRNNGIEFVTVPTKLSEIPASLEEMRIWIAGYKWRASERCSTHVHVDARDYTHVELRNLVTLYCLMEPLLFDYVGKEREESIFCVPWYRSDSDLYNYVESTSKYTKINDVANSLVRESCKYAALHLSPLAKFGTVEFRHAPAWTDMNVLYRWVQMCVDVVNYAYVTPAETIVKEFESGPDTLVGHVFRLSQFRPNGNITDLIEARDSDYLARQVVGMEPINTGWKVQKKKMLIRPKTTVKKELKRKSYFIDSFVEETW